MKLIISNLADVATLGASPAMVTTLPITNLQSESREELARTTSLASQSITCTWAGAQLISGVVLYRGNFTSAATWRIKVYDTSAMGVLLYDSGSQFLAPPKPLGDIAWGFDPLGVSLFTGWGYTFSTLWFPVVTGAYMTIQIDDAANPAGFMQASRLFVAYELDTKELPQKGAGFKWDDTSKQTRTDGGTLRTEAGVSYRSITFSGRVTKESTRSALAEMQRLNGLRKDMYLSLTPEMFNAFARDHQAQVKLVSIDEIVIPGGAFQADVTLSFQEV